MRVAVFGQGSIGRRHAALLLELGHEVVTYDPDPDRRPPAGAQPAPSAEESLRGADAAIVASPSSEHVRDARRAIEGGVPVLVEKPLALSEAHCAELEWLSRERGVMLSVAMNLREHPGVRSLAELLARGAVGDILSARAWCGSWLPRWHPQADYRLGYSASRALGGGVLLDVAVHELDYLLWVAGPVRSVGTLARRVSALEVEVEDVALLHLDLESGAVAQLSVDYFDRSYSRGCRIVGSEGTLHWSWENEELAVHDSADQVSRQAIASDVAPTYRAQMERFLAAVRSGGAAPVPAADARRVLAVIDAARRSSDSGRRVEVPPQVSMRAAGQEDAERLRDWRNDPETRRWSRSSREIAAEEHADWLRGVLADRHTLLWIVEHGGHPVGSVRVGPLTSGAAEVHVAMAPDARGRGLAAAALTEAAARALAEPDVQRLRAHVKPDHAASMRAFARAGFENAGTDDDGFVVLERSIVHR